MKKTRRTISSRLWGGCAVALLAAFAMAESAVAQGLKVAMMPSWTQNRAYANAELNRDITVWGRAWGGTAPYSYVLEFGDGTPDAVGAGVGSSGTIDHVREISAVHQYGSGGSKVARLTVTDATGASVSRTATVRVLVAPTHDERVNMAIERGLLYLYRTAREFGGGGNHEVAEEFYWSNNSNEYGIGATGSTVLAFAENGHKALNDEEDDIYASLVRKGCNTVLHQRSATYNIGAPWDVNGDGKACYVNVGHAVYANSFAGLAVVLSYTRAEAQALTVTTGAFNGMTIYQVIENIIEAYYYSQYDTANGRQGGWVYSMTASQQGTDGSSNQWPALLFRAVEDVWAMDLSAGNGYGVLLSDAVQGWLYLQRADGGIAYTSPGSWVNSTKTGGSLVGFLNGGLGVGDTPVDNAVSYLSGFWNRDGSSGNDNGVMGQFYAMYGVKKGFALQGITTINNPTLGARDWYKDLSGWLLGGSDPSLENGNMFKADSLEPVPSNLAPGIPRQNAWAFGQYQDGHWQNNIWPIRGHVDMGTAHAVLILTQSVTVALPVAVIDPVSVQPRNFAFTMFGDNSFHQDSGLSIVLYEWDFDYDGNTFDVDASGSSTPVNPGYALPGFYTVALRVTDNNPDGANSDIATTIVEVTNNNAPPVSVPIPPGIPSYAGKVGENITLDGSASFDPEGDPIILYSWDLDGDGIYGDDFGPNPVVSFASIYNGVIGLQVTSEDDDGLQQTSTNNTVIDITISPSNLIVDSVSASIIVPGDSADVTVTVTNAADSGQGFTGIVLNFYNADPFLGGTEVGPTLNVDLAIGETKVLGPVNISGMGGADSVFAYIDSNTAIGEYNETDNTGSASVSNTPPVAACNDLNLSAGADCTAVATAETIGAGSSDPDGDPLVYSVVPAGPYAVGVTNVTVTVTDPNGASDSCNATITVVDDTAPVITLTGPADVTLECGVDTYTEEGAEADDNCGVGPVTISGAVVDAPGVYTISYDVTDVNGNAAATVTRTVTVVDTIAPVITLNGAAAGTLECGVDTYTELGATAADHCDPNVSVVVGGDTVDPSTPGVYVVTYNATDASGNAAAQVVRTITVADTIAPVITLNGDAAVTLECAVDTYTELGAGVTDHCDQTVSVVIGGDVVDTTTPGVYVVTYDSTDVSGNAAAQVTRTVTVQDTIAPVITVTGAGTIVLYQGDSYTDAGATVTDECDQTVVVVPGGSVDTSVIGVYTLTYDATDSSGNQATQQTRTVTVLPRFASLDALFGCTDLKAEKSSTVNGSVGSAKKVDLHQAASVTGDAVNVSGNINLNKNASIGGDATAGKLVKLKAGASVGGTITENAVLVDIPLPILAITTSGSNVTVKKNKTGTVAPGSYKKLSGKQNSTINLSTGHYTFSSINVDRGSTINLDVTNGPITVDVVGAVDFDGVDWRRRHRRAVPSPRQQSQARHGSCRRRQWQWKQQRQRQWQERT